MWYDISVCLLLHFHLHHTELFDTVHDYFDRCGMQFLSMWHIMFVDMLRHVFGTIRQLPDKAR